MIPLRPDLLGAAIVIVVVVGLVYRFTAADDSAPSTETTSTGQPHATRFNPDPATWTERSRVTEDTPDRDPETPADSGRDAVQQDDTLKPADLTRLEFGWQTDVDVSFADVGGRTDLKQTLRKDVILPLQANQDLCHAMGITAPNVLFHGPPGTGKTFMARALAGELDVPFVEVSSSRLQSRWINESATKVEELFLEAKRVAESYGGAVVFVDELDSVLRARTAGANAHAEDTKVVAEFLTHLQATNEHDIVFVGATNRKEMLDEAGIRAGRIDCHIEIPMPDQEARAGILAAQLDSRPHTVSGANMKHAARQLEGQSAADISSLVDAAARRAVFSRGGDHIRWGDLQQAIEDYLTNRDSKYD